MIGVIVNTIAVVVGGIIGLCVHRFVNDKIKTAVFAALGLCTLLIGIKGAFRI